MKDKIHFTDLLMQYISMYRMSNMVGCNEKEKMEIVDKAIKVLQVERRILKKNIAILEEQEDV